MSMEKQQKEFKYLLDHRDELLRQYSGKFVIIHGESVVGAFSNPGVAYEKAIEQYKPGEFIIQEINSDELNKPQIFHTRVIQ
jgi:hypothetical protein